MDLVIISIANADFKACPHRPRCAEIIEITFLGKLGNLTSQRFHAIAGTGLALVWLFMLNSQGATMVVRLSSNSNDGSKKASPLVMQVIGSNGKHSPATWSTSESDQFTKERSEFLNNLERGDTRMIWRSYDIRLNSPVALQASILNNPVFFLYENAVNSGSLSASGKLIKGPHKEKGRGKLNDKAPIEPLLESNKNNSFIKDGKIDMDLILIISAGLSGLVLMLIPERKRKRDLIKEANLALLRRPRQ